MLPTIHSDTPFASMRRFHTLVRFDFCTALRAPVVAATTPNIDPLPSIIGTLIVIDELSLPHCSSLLSYL